MMWEEHVKNRHALPPEELAKFYGKHVAWDLEGKRIVASGDDDLAVIRAVTAAGHDLEQVVFSYVPFPDEVILGGAFLTEGEPNE
jgi:hypothetical protein